MGYDVTRDEHRLAPRPDPTVTVTFARALRDNLDLYRAPFPTSVIRVLVIFEARPEVIINIAALALESGACASTVLYHPSDPTEISPSPFSTPRGLFFLHSIYKMLT